MNKGWSGDGVRMAALAALLAIAGAVSSAMAIPENVVTDVRAAYVHAASETRGLPSLRGDRATRIERALEMASSLRTRASAPDTPLLRPRPAAQVWRTREGDCQDRVSLLLALLHREGIRASAALTLRLDALPSETVTLDDFDHVLVLAEDGLWLDPTESLSRLLDRWVLVCDDRPRWVKYGG